MKNCKAHWHIRGSNRKGDWKQKWKPVESRRLMKSREERVLGNVNCSLKYYWESEWRKEH